MPVPIIVQILIEKLMPNPRQPRRRFRRGSIQDMADSLKAVGQQTPLKVRPLTPAEMALYPGFEYMVIGGHRRLAGAKLAGFTALDCIVLNITPAETHLASLMDNDSEEMDWWDWDLAIEEEARSNLGMTQRELAGRLDKSAGKINNALKIAWAFNQAAKDLVTQNLDKAQEKLKEDDPQANKAPKTLENRVQPLNTNLLGFQITESILLILADLVPTRKPQDPNQPVSEESLKEQEEGQKLTIRALNMVLDDYLNEQKTKKLVVWMKLGHQPEEYGVKGAQEAPEDPYAADWQSLAPEVKVKLTGKGYRIQMILEGPMAHAAAFGASNAIHELRGEAVAPVAVQSGAPGSVAGLAGGHPVTEAFGVTTGLTTGHPAPGQVTFRQAFRGLADPEQFGKSLAVLWKKTVFYAFWGGLLLVVSILINPYLHWVVHQYIQILKNPLSLFGR